MPLFLPNFWAKKREKKSVFFLSGQVGLPSHEPYSQKIVSGGLFFSKITFIHDLRIIFHFFLSNVLYPARGFQIHI